jgi:hypothetical protein
MRGGRLEDRIEGRRFKISNNLVAAFAIIITLISVACNVALIIRTNGLSPTGNVAAAGLVKVYVGVPPTLALKHPNPCAVFSDWINIRAEVTDVRGDETVVNVSFFYSNGTSSQGEEWRYLGSRGYNGSITYDYLWNISGLADDIYYKVMVSVVDNQGYTAATVVPNIIINNVDAEPDWEKFKNSYSTNLSQLTEWWNVYNLKLGNSYGQLYYLGQTVSVDGLNLSRYINVSRKKIFLDSSTYPCLSITTVLTFFNVSIRNALVYKEGGQCSPLQCQVLSNNALKNQNVSIRVSEFSTYELSQNAWLEIWDITDPGKYPGNQARYRNQQLGFYANLTDGAELLNDSYTHCFITFNTTGETWPYEMRVGSSGLYEYNNSFPIPGTYYWNVSCNNSDDAYLRRFDEDNVTIINRAPRLVHVLPNITMEQDTTVLYLANLNDYFVDPEGDAMTFNVSEVSNVWIRVVSSSILITPDEGWYGNWTFTVTATDEFGLVNNSNEILLTVVPIPPSLGEGEGGGGGGGGGAEAEGTSEEDFFRTCRDRWICSNWSDCMFRLAWNSSDLSALNALMTNKSVKINEHDGIMIRSCYDKNSCRHPWNRPNESQKCYYAPSCSDHLKNQGEEAVDCGGPCAPCGNCLDGIQNQGEEAVDCGGPCAPCGNCLDGIQNCHEGKCELGIDCGGPCPKICPAEEQPANLGLNYIIPLILLLIIACLFTAYLFLRPHMVRAYMWLMAILNRYKELPKTTLLEIELKYLAQLEKLQKRAIREEPRVIASLVNQVFKGFLVEAFEVKGEKTYEELNEIVTSQKVPMMLKMTVQQFIKETIKEEYSAAVLTKAAVIYKINNTRTLFDMIVRAMPSEEKIDEKKNEEKSKPAAVMRNPLIRIYRLGVEVKRSLARKRIEKAFRLEREMLDLYKSLPQDERMKAEEAVAEVEESIRRIRRVIEKGGKEDQK